MNFEVVDKVMSKELNMHKRNYHWKNASDYEALFGLSVFGPSDFMKEIIRLAKVGAEYESR